MTFDDLRARYPDCCGRPSIFRVTKGGQESLNAYFSVVDREMPDGETYKIGQIKEKLGTLRIYDSSYDAAWASVPPSRKPIVSQKLAVFTRANTAASEVGCASGGRISQSPATNHAFRMACSLSRRSRSRSTTCRLRMAGKSMIPISTHLCGLSRRNGRDDRNPTSLRSAAADPPCRVHGHRRTGRRRPRAMSRYR